MTIINNLFMQLVAFFLVGGMLGFMINLIFGV